MQVFDNPKATLAAEVFAIGALAKVALGSNNPLSEAISEGMRTIVKEGFRELMHPGGAAGESLLEQLERVLPR